MTSHDEGSPQNLSARSVGNLPPTDAGQLEEATTRQTPASVAVDEISAGWTPYFRYGRIYADQRDAIDSFLDILASGGYYLKEGACGTGKTLAAVTASIHAMRDTEQLSRRAPDDESFPEYTRTMVVTPVKQQLQQFIGELRGINANLSSAEKPINTVVLRGRSDMMAVKNADLPGTDERDEIQDLRATTRDLIRFDSEIPLDWPDGLNPPAYSQAGYDWSDASEEAEEAQQEHQYDPVRARAVREIVSQMEPRETDSYDRLHVNGIETPYPHRTPHTRDVVDTAKVQSSSAVQLPAEKQGRFDPFYAATFSETQGDPTSFADAPNYVVDREILFKEAIANGRCPHELMGILARAADLILGNYNHFLDPETRFLTDNKLGLLDDQTIMIVDEAHQLEERSRERLSTSVDIYTLDKARNDVEIARHYTTGNISDTPTPGLNQSDTELARNTAREELYVGSGGVEIDEMVAVELLFDVAKMKLVEASETIEGIRFPPTDSESNLSTSLSVPSQPEWGDHLTDALKEHDTISPSVLETAEQVTSRLEDVYDALKEKEILDRTPQGKEVGAFFRQWSESPREVYHPEARIVSSEKESFPDKYPEWVKHWTPELRLYNCIPQRELRRVFAELGSGVLMSATLRPIAPFKEATGIDEVPQSDALGDEIETEDEETTIRTNGITNEMIADTTSRPTTFDRYPLRFSPENRLSLVVDLPRFTQDNRGSPYNDNGDALTDPESMTETRTQYADIITQVAQTNGNILVAMPSYEEAAWAHDFIQTLSLDKRCLLDESSTATETNALLEEFFDGGSGILCTSLRGTVTEGVDFDGDKLHTCLNIGVPLPPGNSRRDAVEVAYNRAIDSASGHDAAQLIPSTRKVRQSIGRVIRGSEETGVRIVVDERYGTTEKSNLREFLSPQQQREFTLIDPDDINDAISRFWAEQEAN